MFVMSCVFIVFFFFSSRRRHTRCALVTGVQTCALPILGIVEMGLNDTVVVRALFEPVREVLDRGGYGAGLDEVVVKDVDQDVEERPGQGFGQCMLAGPSRSKVAKR